MIISSHSIHTPSCSVWKRKNWALPTVRHELHTEVQVLVALVTLLFTTLSGFSVNVKYVVTTTKREHVLEC